MINALLLILTFIIVSFGQPAFSAILSVLTSIFGFALFWYVLLAIPSSKKRFWVGTFWFACVQAVQLSWLISHPYGYIYGLYLFLAFGIGAQFGLLSILITPDRIKKWQNLLGIAGLYTLFEWSRLFVFSGYSFNPIGLAMTSTLWGLQNASLFGVFGLTFLVLLTNLLVLRFALYARTALNATALIGLILAPYLFGYTQTTWHRPGLEMALNQPETKLNTLLVQTAFPIEEALNFTTFQEALKYVEGEWDQVLKVLRGFQDRKIDLIVLPEYVVPYGTYLAIFPYENIERLFSTSEKVFLPKLSEPLALEIDTPSGRRWQVTNAYMCQAIADIYKADLVTGLQDDQWIGDNEKQSYSSAIYFWPGGDLGLRYEKRVLLPMAEYIPFTFCKELAANYGIAGSFCPGTEAKVFPGCKVPFGLSVCYEEMFGELMLENRKKGAELLINVTSDVWYPNSKLPRQHFDHSRLRTVEAGIPLVRSCNTGITSSLNSLGEVVAMIPEEDEWVRQGLYAEVPLYHYKTLYAMLGDSFIVLVSIVSILFLVRKKPS